MTKTKNEDEDEEPLEDVEFAGGLSIPGDTYERLLPHQKTCLKWLWELHCQPRRRHHWRRDGTR